MVNLNKIRSEIRAMLEISNEFSIDPNGQFAGLQKADAIQNLQMLFEHLKERKVDEIFFNQTTSYFAKPDNIGASYRNKDAGISDIQIRKIILSEIKKLIEPIENRYVFILFEDMPEFDDFLNTGVPNLNLNQSNINSTPSANNFNFTGASNNFAIKKATMIQYRCEEYHIQEEYNFFRIKVECSQNTQDILKSYIESRDIIDSDGNSITIEICDNRYHCEKAPSILLHAENLLYKKYQQFYPNDWSEKRDVQIDVTDIMSDLVNKLKTQSQSQNQNSRYA